MATSRTALRERQAVLVEVPFLSELAKRHPPEIARTAWVAEYPEQMTLCREGSVESAFYVLVEGRVRVERGRTKVARLAAGEFLVDLSS